MRLMSVFLGLLMIAASGLAQVPDSEIAARQAHAAASIGVESVLLDVAGQRLPNRAVTVRDASGTVVLGQGVTDPDGYFQITGLARENAMLEVDVPGYRVVHLYLHLAQSLAINQVTLDPIVLVPLAADEVRFLFGGDTAWVRRFYDTDLDGRVKLFDIPASDPEAIIDTADPLLGTSSTIQFVKPPFLAADFSSVNLETPVLSSPPFTPHIEKDFAFFTLRDSILALPEFGIDYVALGNNHLWDYLSDGVDATIESLSNDLPTIGFSGAGQSESDAFLPYRFDLKSHAYSMLSATSITGSANEFSDPFYLYVADDEYSGAFGNSKGGAADLTDRSTFRSYIETERNDSRIPIVQLHTGDEYTFEPSTTPRNRMIRAIDDGAGLVIAHHPHVAQGVEFYQGKLIAHSLGNFVFDQERLETMLGMTAQLDYRGEEFLRGRVGGIYLEDFRPRPIAGDWAGTFLRRINQFSRQALVFAYNGQGWIQPNASGTQQRTYAVTAEVELNNVGQGVLDLRGLRTDSGIAVPVEASVSAISTATAVSFQLGRDIMERQGEFEDYDVDDDGLGDPTSTDSNSYSARWFWDSSTDAKYLCLEQPYRGMAAACSVRTDRNESDTVIAFRNRIRLMRAESCGPVNPNRDLTLFGYVRGVNAGAMRAEVKYYPSRDQLISFIPPDDSPNETLDLGSGTFAWRPVAKNLTLPIDDTSAYPEPDPASGSCSQVLKTHIREQTARALRVFLDHSPPSSGEGLASFDEFAVINWQPELAGGAVTSVAVASPHSWDFLRVTGAPNTTVSVELTLSRLIPAMVAGVVIEPFDDDIFSNGFESELPAN